MLDHCIVKITIDKRVVYQHPTYHMPFVFTDKFTTGDNNEYKYYLVNENEPNKPCWSFKELNKCVNALKFLKGEANRK